MLELMNVSESQVQAITKKGKGEEVFWNGEILDPKVIGTLINARYSPIQIKDISSISEAIARENQGLNMKLIIPFILIMIGVVVLIMYLSGQKSSGGTPTATLILQLIKLIR